MDRNQHCILSLFISVIDRLVSIGTYFKIYVVGNQTKLVVIGTYFKIYVVGNQTKQCRNWTCIFINLSKSGKKESIH